MYLSADWYPWLYNAENETWFYLHESESSTVYLYDQDSDNWIQAD